MPLKKLQVGCRYPSSIALALTGQHVDRFKRTGGQKLLCSNPFSLFSSLLFSKGSLQDEVVISYHDLCHLWIFIMFLFLPLFHTSYPPSSRCFAIHPIPLARYSALGFVVWTLLCFFNYRSCIKITLQKEENQILNIHWGQGVGSSEILCYSLREYSPHREYYSGDSGEGWAWRVSHVKMAAV